MSAIPTLIVASLTGSLLVMVVMGTQIGGENKYYSVSEVENLTV